MATRIPIALGDPMGYKSDVPRVVCRAADRHIYEFWMTDRWHSWNMTAGTRPSAILAAVDEPRGNMAVGQLMATVAGP